MLTVYTFGARFGLPDPSPFCMKAIVLLKMSGLPFKIANANLGKAPKGKAPYLEDDGLLIPDSTFIRLHLENKHGIDFDAGLSPEERGIAWAFEKMCEEHLYFHILHDRWMDDNNFNRGPRTFFESIPPLLRPMIVSKVRRDIRKALRGQGTGRHSQAEITLLASKSLEALSDFLGDKPFLMGDQPCGADASAFSFVAGVLCPQFNTKVRTRAEELYNLGAYNRRCMKLWFSEN